MNINDMLKKSYDTLMANDMMPEGVKDAATNAMQMVKVVRNDRMRVRAGVARARVLNKKVITCSIEWNSTLFSRMTEEQQYNTVSHEFAHIVEFFCKGDSDHGYFWQAIHRACGGTAARTHNYNVHGLRNNVKRLSVRDTLTGRDYINISQRTYNKIKHMPRYVLMKTEVYQGTNLVAAHNHY